MYEEGERAYRPAGGAGGERLFQELYQTYYRPLVYFFVRRGIGREDARELAQETFVRVYKGMEGFRREAQVKTWIFRIATNLLFNQRRYWAADRRRGELVSIDDVGVRQLSAVAEDGGRGAFGEAPIETALARERSTLLRRALDELPPKMQRALLLRIDGGFKYREIADLMNVSINTVKTQLYQARQQLKAKLGDYFDDRESLPSQPDQDDEREN